MDITGASAAGAALAAIPASAAVPPGQLANNRNLIQAIQAVNESGTLADNTEITFQIDRNSRLPLVQIIDTTTNKVIEQIPPEYIIQLAETLGKGDSASLSTLA